MTSETNTFRVHVLSPTGERSTVRIQADSPNAIRMAVRKELPGYQIQKVKVDRSGGPANG
ncbi:hypothetical protein V5F77_04240 [Xanthobacter sp. DSM 24535]|uniref:hypothetical protein n=1 Tax=Roseixanthobacter psychrophilus TaxID=3119917 RepID=UPI0037288D9E